MRRLVVFVLLAGCVPLSYTFTPSTSAPIMGKPKNCKFEVKTSQPTEGFEEIGILDHYNGDAPKDTETFKKAVAEQVCETGGDAVIVTANEKGQYTKGSIVKYVHHAEPVKPITDVPTTQAPDSELPKKK
ncbi:MAG TPA: hypothetical protein VIV40_07730 [Kofleriaceae bacterium]